MSNGFTVQCFKNGDISKFPRSIVWEAFQQYARRPAISGWDLTFPDGSTSHLRLDDSENVTGFGLSRPAGDTALMNAVYSVLSRVPSIMIWSSDGRCVVADRSVVTGIPDWLLKALPTPVVVDSGQAIDDFLVRTSQGP